MAGTMCHEYAFEKHFWSRAKFNLGKERIQVGQRKTLGILGEQKKRLAFEFPAIFPVLFKNRHPPRGQQLCSAVSSAN